MIFLVPRFISFRSLFTAWNQILSELLTFRHSHFTLLFHRFTFIWYSGLCFSSVVVFSPYCSFAQPTPLILKPNVKKAASDWLGQANPTLTFFSLVVIIWLHSALLRFFLSICIYMPNYWKKLDMIKTNSQYLQWLPVCLLHFQPNSTIEQGDNGAI